MATSPYYLYKSFHTKYTSYKDSRKTESHVYKNDRVTYDKEIDMLAKHEGFIESSSFFLDKETDRNLVDYEFMKRYVQLLKTKQDELSHLNIPL